MKNSTPSCLATVLILLNSAVFSASGEGHSINQTEIVGDGATLVSKSGIFAMGFFHGAGSTRYLGIWYTFSTDTVVWVANRRNPIEAGSSGVLQLTGNGDLVINATGGGVVWRSNSRSPAVRNPVATLGNSGNLVVTNGDGGGVIWQSFDHLSDTLITGMKLGFDKKTDREWYLTAWKQNDDPSPGDYLLKMDKGGSHEIYLYRTPQTQKVFRFGPWNGLWFGDMTDIGQKNNLTYWASATIFMFNMGTKGVPERLVVLPNGATSYMKWRKETSRWITYWTTDICDSYSKCGPNGMCGNFEEELFCRCFTGFRRRSNSSWSLGCERKEELKLNCSGGRGEGFLLRRGVKLPDTTNSTIHKHIGLKTCRNLCIGNCSCVAYAPLYLMYISPRGCVMWFGDLVDIKSTPLGDGLDLYIRLPLYELPSKHNRTKITIIVVTIASGLIALSLFGILIWMWKKKKVKAHKRGSWDAAFNDYDDTSKLIDELPLFEFSTIALSTNNFSFDCKIGQGGFGSVYKGTLADGEEIAVKRLSRSSRQGVDEFMNEVKLIAKLQHRNLVRLLGCCVDEEERMLIYEFMPNKSLNSFIFGESRHLLDWKKRVDIIIGIARGLLYLHQDSRLRIIHRDLKAGNVLLDSAMNPKISDFGTARLFGEDQIEENTINIIGTYGYMSPEYVIGGIFSMKSDVFSFGVLLLEIISGKKSRALYQNENISLLEMAWMVWKDGKCDELLDECLSQSCSMPQVIHFIKIGLLCVEDHAVDRPTVSEVVFMLSNLNAYTPQPKQPAFCGGSTSFRKENASDTINEVTLTEQEAR